MYLVGYDLLEVLFLSRLYLCIVCLYNWNLSQYLTKFVVTQFQMRPFDQMQDWMLGNFLSDKNKQTHQHSLYVNDEDHPKLYLVESFLCSNSHFVRNKLLANPIQWTNWNYKNEYNSCRREISYFNGKLQKTSHFIFSRKINVLKMQAELS